MGTDRSRRTVIITGAGSGLGRAITIRLLHDGLRCVLAGPERAGLDETIARAGADDDRATAVLGDVRVPADRERLIEHAVAQPGRLYGLVNNAGIARHRPLLDETPQDWRDTFETNLEAAYFLSQRAIEQLKADRDGGRIVNVASMYGIVGMDNRGYGDRAPETTPGDRGPVRQSAYDASKAGLIHLTKTLAAAVGRWGITVNAISPGSVPWVNEEAVSSESEARGARQQGLGDKVDPTILEALAEQVPLRRLGRSEEIAGPVSFLLSDDASYITGHNLVADGGFTIW